MGQLDNKIAIVTGAARGLGRGIAEKLASHGATVVLTDVNEDGVRQAARGFTDSVKEDSVRDTAQGHIHHESADDRLRDK